MHFGSHFNGFLELIFATFSDFAKNSQPFETIVNSSEIEGLAVGKSTKKHSKTDEKIVKKPGGKSDAFFVDFGYILKLLGALWGSKCYQNRVKF